LARCWWPSRTNMHANCGWCWRTMWTTTPVPTFVTRCIAQLNPPKVPSSFHRQREVVDNGSDPPGENLTNILDVQTCFGWSPNTDDTVERMRSPGAVYTLVRISSTDATRPSKEMQSGNVQHRAALTRSTYAAPEIPITGSSPSAQGKSIMRLGWRGSLLRNVRTALEWAGPKIAISLPHVRRQSRRRLRSSTARNSRTFLGLSTLTVWTQVRESGRRPWSRRGQSAARVACQ